MNSDSEQNIYKPVFTGTGSEYFRIWIVNTFLTIITLGIYAAWAKVRNRRYFYKNTLLDGKSFDYVANPLAILKGNLILGTGILLYFLTELYNPMYTFIMVLILYLVIPFLVYKSLRFYAHNSTYRNIRFGFLGTLGDSYRTYLLIPALIPFTLGLILPYWTFRRKKYFFDNFAFGMTGNVFEGRPGPFYGVYLLTGVLLVVFLFLTFFAMGVFVPLLQSAAPPNPDEMGMSMLLLPIIMYMAFLIIVTFAEQYLYSWSTNYCWQNSALGKLRFRSTLRAGNLIWIRITNILAIVASLGLLIPWAKVRRTRYVLDNISVITAHSLDEFHASVEPDESAFGDAATDFFDLEIGL